MTLFESCILYPAQYNFIWRVSFVSAFSSAYAVYRGHYNLAIVPSSVLLTSLNYWRLPTYGWRRNLDIACVCSALIYQSVCAYRMSTAVPYYRIMGIASLLYPMSIYLYKKKCYWGSTYAHCMLHIIANIGNVVLYSGNGRHEGEGWLHFYLVILFYSLNHKIKIEFWITLYRFCSTCNQQ